MMRAFRMKDRHLILSVFLEKLEIENANKIYQTLTIQITNIYERVSFYPEYKNI